MTVPFAQDTTRTRYAAGTKSGGVYTPGATSTATIQASVQPAGYATLQRLTEGMRTRGVVDIWSEDELRTSSVDGLTLPDEITYQGDQWQVEDVDPYIADHHTPDLLHYRAVAVRKVS